MDQSRQLQKTAAGAFAVVLLMGGIGMMLWSVLKPAERPAFHNGEDTEPFEKRPLWAPFAPPNIASIPWQNDYRLPRTAQVNTAAAPWLREPSGPREPAAVALAMVRPIPNGRFFNRPEPAAVTSAAQPWHNSSARLTNIAVDAARLPTMSRINNPRKPDSAAVAQALLPLDRWPPTTRPAATQPAPTTQAASVSRPAMPATRSAAATRSAPATRIAPPTQTAPATQCASATQSDATTQSAPPTRSATATTQRVIPASRPTSRPSATQPG